MIYGLIEWKVKFISFLLNQESKITNLLQIFKDAHIGEADAPYLVHQCTGTVTDLRFSPYEDVLGVGHQNGFTSLIVPGKFWSLTVSTMIYWFTSYGKGSNCLLYKILFHKFFILLFCTYMYVFIRFKAPVNRIWMLWRLTRTSRSDSDENTRSRRYWIRYAFTFSFRLVEYLSDSVQIQPELITLDTSDIARVNTEALEAELERKAKVLYLKPQKIDYTPRHRMKGKSAATKKVSLPSLFLPWLVEALSSVGRSCIGRRLRN